MKLGEFLESTLIETKDFDVTVYEVLIILLIFIFTALLMRVIKRVFRVREKRKELDSGRI